MIWFSYWMAVADFWYGPIIAPPSRKPARPSADVVQFADYKRTSGGAR
jgi:hypothetical protein